MTLLTVVIAPILSTRSILAAQNHSLDPSPDLEAS